MKKIVNTLSAFLRGQRLNNIAGKGTAINNLPVQPVYSQPSTGFINGAAKNRSLPFITGAFFLLMICTSLSSCFTSGYGCKGKSHCMTRVS